MRHPPQQAGFSLVELLIASVVTLVVVGGAVGLMGPAQGLFQAQPEASDVQQRLRVGAEALRRDLMMAGAGMYAGPATGPLNFLIAPVMPYKAFGSVTDPAQGVYFRSDTISFLYVPSTASQTRLVAALLPGAVDVELDPLPNCPVPTSTEVCGFAAGDRMLLLDAAGNWEIARVDQVAGTFVRLRRQGPHLLHRFDPGTIVSEVTSGSYSLKTDAASSTYQLMRHDGWATELPVVDEVVGLEFRYFGDPDPPQLTGEPLDVGSGPWTTYGPAPPLAGVTRGMWAPGENCTFLVANGVHVPRLATLAAGIDGYAELTPAMLGDGPWCPDQASPARVDADLLRVRRVRVELRVQSALASLRGPAGSLFRVGGTARAGNRYVPDLSVQFDVMPRNMNLGR